MAACHISAGRLGVEMGWGCAWAMESQKGEEAVKALKEREGRQERGMSASSAVAKKGLTCTREDSSPPVSQPSPGLLATASCPQLVRPLVSLMSRSSGYSQRESLRRCLNGGERLTANSSFRLSL